MQRKTLYLIAASVLLIGWKLGGDVGFGTLAFALLIGPLCGLTLPLFGIRKPPPVVLEGTPPAD